jgi:hypothetical protein
MDEPAGLSETLRPLYLYWVAACGEKQMPARADIDPVEMPIQLLSNLVLVDVVSGPLRFRYRVMGTDVARMLGEDWTARFLDQIPDVHESIRQQYQATVEISKPTVKMNEYDRYDPSLMQHKLLRYERLLMPLSENGINVTMLLGGTVERPTVW